jgi:hypothetical protein
VYRHDKTILRGAMIDREALLDELARCFVQAAVSRLLREQRDVERCGGKGPGLADSTSRDRCEPLGQPKDSNASPAPVTQKFMTHAAEIRSR